MTTKITDANMETTGVTAGSYTAADINVNSSGRIVSAATNPLTGVGGPKISDVVVTNSSWTVLNDTAVDTAGGYVKLLGSGFASGCQVVVGTTQALSTSFISSSEVRVQLPAIAAGTYIVYLINPDGGTAIRVNGITFSASPVWVTDSNLGSILKNLSYSQQLTATGANTYALANGSSLPSGLTLSSSGLISGTTPNVTDDTLYTFTIIATDPELQDSPRTFTLTVQTIVYVETQYLLVAGGGGGGSGATWGGNGGGGAGGYRTGTIQMEANLATNITIGAGGATSTKGSNSTFYGITTYGGGTGGSNMDGGSGGGGHLGSGAKGYGVYLGSPYISETIRQGYDGGNGGGWCAGYYGSCGGGGGAGGVGTSGSCAQVPGPGGPGIANPVVGSTTGQLSGGVYYICGGGGGAGAVGGIGGGGGYTSPGPGTAGLVNTGGGGCGSDGTTGGSGVLVLKISNNRSMTFSAGLTSSLNTSVSGYKIYTVTAGTGTVTIPFP